MPPSLAVHVKSIDAAVGGSDRGYREEAIDSESRLWKTATKHKYGIVSVYVHASIGEDL